MQLKLRGSIGPGEDGSHPERNSTTVAVFVDTNVLVYVRDVTEPEKQRRAAEWVTALWETGHGRLSEQVLQEYYVTLTRKLSPPRNKEDAREDVFALRTWKPVGPSRGITEAAWRIEDRFEFSWWDSLIVASAIASCAEFLLTEDLSSGQTVDTIKIISPFEVRPEEVLTIREE